MNATFTVTFEGFPEKLADALEKMLRDDIAFYPNRVKMKSASVEQRRTIKTPARSIPRAQIAEAAQKVKNA